MNRTTQVSDQASQPSSGQTSGNPHTGSDVEETANKLDWEKMAGLIPAVVTHAVTGKVLMVAWCNREAITRTVQTGNVTFFSRSRQQLWTKGETSGNTLAFHRLRADCDADTLLIEALPAGPVCHTGTESCFDDPIAQPPLGFLGELEQIILSRKEHADSDGSYTAELFARGLPKIAQKVGEEGVEVALAGVLNSTEDLIDESADLVYHLLVLLAAKDQRLTDVVARLRERHTG